MAAMMILMVVLLVIGGPGDYLGSHAASSPPSQVWQSHENGAAKPDPEKP